MIDVGKYARYTNTGTIGKVLEIVDIDGRKFACLEGTDLYYDIKYLEETSKPKDRKEIKMDLKEQTKIQEEMLNSIESVEMSENTGGG